jgi:glyoxylase-like metal-dependent hydrolase (beta-lactamase superfamily II)/rhodanese-related sulfurtransferase
MYVEQIYTNCLAEASYYIESNGEAAIVDPIRETEPYLELANSRGATIKYIFETHFHADFVSGHLDLAKATGATIVFGPGAQPSYEILEAADGQTFELGACKLRLLHTPGHTLESSCVVLVKEDGTDHAVFTGDTLFIGDVGRPDLAANPELSRQELASMLYHSIQDKLLLLPNEVVVYPGHGAGSQCGKNLSTETVSSIGHEKEFNYALQQPDEHSFVDAVTEGILPPPAYFPKNVKINKIGYEELTSVLDRESQPLSVKRFKEEVAAGAMILDSRQAEVFAGSHIPGAINIDLNGFFAIWAGTIIPDLEQELVIVAPQGEEQETIKRLARVGFDQVVGFLDEGFEAWTASNEEVDSINMISAQDFNYGFDITGQILDVRKQAEFADLHFTATNIPLAELPNRLQELEKNKTYYVCCQSGYRSMIACSLLKKAGFNHIINMEGGMNAFLEEGDKKSCSV